MAAGYDVTIGHYFCRDRNNNDHFVEFTFWGLNSWSRLENTRRLSRTHLRRRPGLRRSATASLINQGTGVPAFRRESSRAA